LKKFAACFLLVGALVQCVVYSLPDEKMVEDLPFALLNFFRKESSQLTIVKIGVKLLQKSLGTLPVFFFL
jgi:hypothetical protein